MNDTPPTWLVILIALPIYFVARTLESRLWIWWNYGRRYKFARSVYSEEVLVPDYASSGAFVTTASTVGLTWIAWRNRGVWSESMAGSWAVLVVVTFLSPVIARMVINTAILNLGVGGESLFTERGLRKMRALLSSRLDVWTPVGLLGQYRRFWRALVGLEILKLLSNLDDKRTLVGEIQRDLDQARGGADAVLTKRIGAAERKLEKRSKV